MTFDAKAQTKLAVQAGLLFIAVIALAAGIAWTIFHHDTVTGLVTSLANNTTPGESAEATSPAYVPDTNAVPAEAFLPAAAAEASGASTGNAGAAPVAVNNTTTITPRRIGGGGGGGGGSRGGSSGDDDETPETPENPVPPNNGNNSTTPPSDTTAPQASVTAPSQGQQFAAGTTSVTLSVTTTEAAQCRWSTETGKPYADMPNPFSTTGGQQHSTTVNDLANGQSYTRYVRCRDTAGNAMQASAAASFSVLSPATPPPPSQVDAGDTVRVDIVANSVTDLAGVQFDLTYNNAVLGFTGISEGPFLDSGNATAAMLINTTAPTNGRLANVIVLRVAQPGRSGSGTLASITFRGTSSGSANAALGNVLLSDRNGNPIAASRLSIQTSVSP